MKHFFFEKKAAKNFYPLVRLQRRAFTIGVDPGRPEDFIGIGVADAGDELATRQHSLDLSAERFQPGAKVVERNLQRLRSHAGEIRNGGRVASQVDLTHSLLIDVAQLAASREREHEDRVGHAFLFRRSQLQAPCEFRIDDE